MVFPVQAKNIITQHLKLIAETLLRDILINVFKKYLGMAFFVLLL